WNDAGLSPAQVIHELADVDAVRARLAHRARDVPDLVVGAIAGATGDDEQSSGLPERRGEAERGAHGRRVVAEIEEDADPARVDDLPAPGVVFDVEGAERAHRGLVRDAERARRGDDAERVLDVVTRGPAERDRDLLDAHEGAAFAQDDAVLGHDGGAL